jgi:hypothetical protein
MCANNSNIIVYAAFSIDVESNEIPRKHFIKRRGENMHLTCEHFQWVIGHDNIHTAAMRHRLYNQSSKHILSTSSADSL